MIAVDAEGFHGVSPAVLREHARVEWDAAFMFTCRCEPRVVGVRFERGGMTCGRCDRPVVRRGSP